MLNMIKDQFQEKSKKSISNFVDQLKKIRTGRANPAILDNISVEYYGAQTPLSQVATISVPEARMILIQPWDKSSLHPIEKAIQKSELGFNPQNDGNVIRITIPPLTQETRLGYVKEAKNIAEQARVSIRNLRRDANEALKKSLKKGEINEDQEKQGLEQVQKLTDDHIKDINTILEKKEKEIIEI